MRLLLLAVLLACCSFTAKAQEKIIEHEGNDYIIHVEPLNPDREMTLLDVLHICPELISLDGKALVADYLLSVDDILLSIDYEPLLQNIKACDLSEVTVRKYGSVINGMEGLIGYIDLKFREGSGMTGKLALSGSTYGNGQVYADVAGRGEKVTVRAIAQTNLQYGRSGALSGCSVTSRNGIENAMLFVDWQATEKDLVRLKLSQGYDEQKDLHHNIDQEDESEFLRMRWVEFVAAYEHLLNEQEASLNFETGLNHGNTLMDDLGIKNISPWWIAECSVPFLKHALTMTAGYEIGYSNFWYPTVRREQYLYNDLYVQLDFKKGPWVASIGDRFRHNTFWDKHYDQQTETLWSHNRNNHALHASLGYKAGRHFVQGTFGRSFINPLVSNFCFYTEEGTIQHNTDYKTNLAWRSEARYTYQTKRLVAMACVTHTRLTDMPSPNESLTGFETSFSWQQGALRLTAGANVYHDHISDVEPLNDTYYVLKFAPVLLLGKGFRLSSMLIYNSKQDESERHAHLYGSVKLNKELGKRCNVFADFHDWAGQPKIDTTPMGQAYYNRALTIGLTYYLGN